MITRNALRAIVYAGFLVVSLVSWSGCRSAGAQVRVAPGVNSSAVVGGKADSRETPVVATNRPGFFARLFGSKPQRPASVQEGKRSAPPAVVAVKPEVQKSVAKDGVNKQGFFARLFAGKTNELTAVVSTSAAAAKPPAAKTLPGTSADGSKTFIPYRIQMNDTLMVALRGITPEQPNVELVVDEHGEIKLPYINNIKAEGLTTSELETLIRETYVQQKIYKRLTVNIIVPAMTAPTFYVKGEVRSPGRLPYVNGMTLLTAIVAAGGPTEYFTPNMELLRGGKKLKFNYFDLEKHPEQDQPIQAGDIIIVNKSWL